MKTNGELFIPHSVEIRDISATEDISSEYDNGIRIFGGSANKVLQIRAVGPLDEKGKGKPRRIIATAAYLSDQDIRAIISKLQSLLS